MRVIAQDTDLLQPLIIFLIIAGYFFVADALRGYLYHPFILSVVTFMHTGATMLYFALFTLLSYKQKRIQIHPFIMLFTYALIPTLIWFIVNSWLFVILPPPRTLSFMGKGFSILYISFSVAILAWKIILMYLAIRYATRFAFFRIMYSLVVYLVIIIPYSILLYSLGVFRIPFL